MIGVRIFNTKLDRNIGISAFMISFLGKFLIQLYAYLPNDLYPSVIHLDMVKQTIVVNDVLHVY